MGADPAKVVLKLCMGQITALSTALREANGRLAGLLKVLQDKGLVTYDEWLAGVKEIEAAAAIEEATDPHHRILEKLYDRLLGGEEVSADEIDRAIHEALSGDEESAP